MASMVGQKKANSIIGNSSSQGFIMSQIYLCEKWTVWGKILAKTQTFAKIVTFGLFCSVKIRKFLGYYNALQKKRFMTFSDRSSPIPSPEAFPISRLSINLFIQRTTQPRYLQVNYFGKHNASYDHFYAAYDNFDVR